MHPIFLIPALHTRSACAALGEKWAQKLGLILTVWQRNTLTFGKAFDQKYVWHRRSVYHTNTVCFFTKTVGRKKIWLENHSVGKALLSRFTRVLSSWPSDCCCPYRRQYLNPRHMRGRSRQWLYTASSGTDKSTSALPTHNLHPLSPVRRSAQ